MDKQPTNSGPYYARSWRLNAMDVEILDELSRELGVKQIDVVRLGLRKLRESHRRSRPTVVRDPE